MRLRATIAFLGILAAAPVSAQPQDGQPFRIFFDWGEPELTRDARSTLDDVVAAYSQLKPNRIEIAGHTDRSGSEAVNLAASRRRVEAARSYLAERGVSASTMAVSAHGETRPIIPTEDGVREAQNRRVEITFR